jgi:hypothetical protein
MARPRREFLQVPKKVEHVGGYWFLASGTDGEGFLRVLPVLETCPLGYEGLLDECRGQQVLRNYRVI